MRKSPEGQVGSGDHEAVQERAGERMQKCPGEKMLDGEEAEMWR